MEACGDGLVVGAVLDPDGVEVDGLGEGAEEREDVDDLGGVGGELGLVDDGVSMAGER